MPTLRSTELGYEVSYSYGDRHSPARIHNLEVTGTERGKGVGSLAMRIALNDIITQGQTDSVELICHPYSTHSEGGELEYTYFGEGTEEFDRAVKFYKKVGFESCENIPNEGLRMRLVLRR